MFVNRVGNIQITSLHYCAVSDTCYFFFCLFLLMAVIFKFGITVFHHKQFIRYISKFLNSKKKSHIKRITIPLEKGNDILKIILVIYWIICFLYF